MTLKVVIIGGDAAGMSAASKIKRELEDAQVVVFERSDYISYSACGMPYWIAGFIESDQDLLVLTPERARKRRGIDVRTRQEVVAIDRAGKAVTVRELDSGREFAEPYDKLVIATGASPARPPIPGLDLPGVFTLRALADSQHIQHYLAANQPATAVIVGGGYIGVEMAEALTERGVAVHLVEMLPQIMPNFDAEMVEEVTTHLAQKGVQVHTGASVQRIETAGDGLTVVTDGGSLPAGLVLVATGVRPNAELARDAGLRLGRSGAIWVDDHMRSSDPDIYAAGDCVEHHHLVLGEGVYIPLAPSANKGGRIAGDNISGGDAAFPGIVGTAVVKVFDYTVAVTGLTEKVAKASGKFGVDGDDVGSAVISAYDKAHYWPGAQKMKVKLVFRKSDGRILGCQLAGKAGVNKRIDIIVAAMAGNLTVSDIGLLDLSYAPPYSPVYDPLQVCANVAAKGAE